MAKLFLSMSGEGRGHATRARALVQALAAEHQLTLFAPGDAYAFLEPLSAGSRVRVERLPGLRFAYDERHRLRYLGTLRLVATYLKALPATVDGLSQRVRRERPDLVLTDFEPALPRAARRCGVPFLSLDHQHFLGTYDLRGLPWALRFHAGYMRWIVGAYYSGQAETVVSSFYFPPLRRDCRRVTQIGVLLRPEVASATPRLGTHLVSYGRRTMTEPVLEVLARSGLDIRVYGCGARPARGKLTFHAVSEVGFLEDLAGCCALVSTAGNQLVGEALCLGKPVLALPEPNNFEQAINAHFLEASGAGATVPMSAFGPADLQRFLARLEEHRRCIDRSRLNGLPAALEVIRRHLPRPAAGVTLDDRRSG
jgi:uncharacterized protein (TIGR00661 family)